MSLFGRIYDIFRSVLGRLALGERGPDAIEEYLAKRAADVPGAKDYKNSIVDLLKVLGIDHSFAERQELAEEMGVVEDASDYRGTAAQNQALHRAVMQRVAQRSDTTI